MTADSLMLKVSKGIINFDGEVVRAVGAFTPDPSDIMKSVPQIFYNCWLTKYLLWKRSKDFSEKQLLKSSFLM